MKIELPPGISFSVTTKRIPLPVMPKEFLKLPLPFTSRSASPASSFQFFKWLDRRSERSKAFSTLLEATDLVENPRKKALSFSPRRIFASPFSTYSSTPISTSPISKLSPVKNATCNSILPSAAGLTSCASRVRPLASSALRRRMSAVTTVGRRQRKALNRISNSSARIDRASTENTGCSWKRRGLGWSA